MHASLIGRVANCKEAHVTAGELLQTVKAVLLPLSAKQDTISHPVMHGILEASWTSLIPRSLKSRVQQCNANKSQYPLQPRPPHVLFLAPLALWQVLSLGLGHRCQQYKVGQSFSDLPGLHLWHVKSS